MISRRTKNAPSTSLLSRNQFKCYAFTVVAFLSIVTSNKIKDVNKSEPVTSTPTFTDITSSPTFTDITSTPTFTDITSTPTFTDTNKKRNGKLEQVVTEISTFKIKYLSDKLSSKDQFDLIAEKLLDHSFGYIENSKNRTVSYSDKKLIKKFSELLSKINGNKVKSGDLIIVPIFKQKYPKGGSTVSNIKFSNERVRKIDNIEKRDSSNNTLLKIEPHKEERFDGRNKDLKLYFKFHQKYGTQSLNDIYNKADVGYRNNYKFTSNLITAESKRNSAIISTIKTFTEKIFKPKSCYTDFDRIPFSYYGL